MDAEAMSVWKYCDFSIFYAFHRSGDFEPALIFHSDLLLQNLRFGNEAREETH
jgi:hypothetical protein